MNLKENYLVASAPWRTEGDEIVGRALARDIIYHSPATVVATVRPDVEHGGIAYRHYPVAATEHHRAVIQRAPRILKCLVDLMGAVEELSGYWNESVANMMQQAEQVLTGHDQPESAKTMTPPPDDEPNVLEYLNHADDDSAKCLGNLMGACNQVHGGLVNLLLLDLIRQSGELNARINAVRQAREHDELSARLNRGVE